MRMCLRHEECIQATGWQGYSTTLATALVLVIVLSRVNAPTDCRHDLDDSCYIQYPQPVLPRACCGNPCVHVQVVAPLLPKDFFLTFRQLGYNVTVQRFDPETFEPFAPAQDAPGEVWVSELNNWRSGPHFAVHKADVLRMLILYKMGGSYMDFDHIVLRPMLHISNGVGRNYVT